MERVSENVSFGGTHGVYEHASHACASTMKFSVYQPPQTKSAGGTKVPVVFFLAGLECNEQTFAMKAGAQRIASDLGLMIVMPDTSPRQTPYSGDDASWDFGTAASFYVDATRDPWSASYRMHTYVTRELPALVREHFPANKDMMGIMGHSMGGHGALVAALKNPGLYESVSAFAPVCAPTQCPWGEKAFAGYLGEERDTWKEWDACALVERVQLGFPLRVDQGTADKFLEAQLKPNLLRDACARSGQALELHMREGYDHSYYFIATFIEEHLRHHASRLGA